ncbi:MAG: helix-turn-helix domain-containing protein [Chitinophagaceae bacterium]
MRVLQTEITPGLQQPYAVVRKKGKSFTSVLHAHPELELVWVRRGRGQRIIGQQISHFEENDMILLGSNLPHRWIYDETIGKEAQSVVIYFHPGLLAEKFYDMPAAESIRELLQAASNTGIQITGPARARMAGKVEKLSRQSGLSVCLGILELLHYLSQQRSAWQLPAAGETVIRHQSMEDRLQPVYKYVTTHYAKDISLAEIAALVHLSETAFCRLFRQRTQTHFVAYLNEVRIQHACDRLQVSDDSISQIALSCGFKSLSNFNKCFRRARGLSPLHYRQKFLALGTAV